MTGTTAVSVIYFSAVILWFVFFGMKLLKRSWLYSIPIMLFLFSSGLLILGTNYGEGRWAAVGYLVYGFLGMGLSLVIHFIVFIIVKDHKK
ncbi:hypothetical protein [Bacillus sp. AK031]